VQAGQGAYVPELSALGPLPAPVSHARRRHDPSRSLTERGDLQVREPLIPGLTHTETLQVDDRLIVPAVLPAFTGFQDMPPVFATAFMVGFVEWTCVEALRPFLEPHEHSVGTRIDMSHINPTPVGLCVTAKIVLTGINGRMLGFEVFCSDELGEIGS